MEECEKWNWNTTQERQRKRQRKKRRRIKSVHCAVYDIHINSLTIYIDVCSVHCALYIGKNSPTWAPFFSYSSHFDWKMFGIHPRSVENMHKAAIWLWSDVRRDSFHHSLRLYFSLASLSISPSSLAVDFVLIPSFLICFSYAYSFGTKEWNESTLRLRDSFFTLKSAAHEMTCTHT